MTGNWTTPRFSRRSALGLTAKAAAGLALSSASGWAEAAGPGPVMRELSDYMARAATKALPAEVAEHAKHHLLDTLASMVSGSELLPGKAALRYIRAHGARGAATIVGSMLTATPADAA